MSDGYGLRDADVDSSGGLQCEAGTTSAEAAQSADAKATQQGKEAGTNADVRALAIVVHAEAPKPASGGAPAGPTAEVACARPAAACGVEASSQGGKGPGCNPAIVYPSMAVCLSVQLGCASTCEATREY